MTTMVPSVASSSRRMLQPRGSRPLLKMTTRSATTEAMFQPPFRGYERPFRSDVQPPPRPPRPDTPTFFTGLPVYMSEMDALKTTTKTIEQGLRSIHAFPLPPSVPLPASPVIRWISAIELRDKEFKGVMLTAKQYDRLCQNLNELKNIGWHAELADRPDLAQKASEALSKFTMSRPGRERKEEKDSNPVDVYGRTHGLGRRKTATANVWIIPSKSAQSFLEPSSSSMPEQPTEGPIPSGEILVNHLPLPLHFQRVQDRNMVIKPLKLAGLLGAYNVFAQVRGGGPTGQAGAVAMGLAKALVAMDTETKPVLFAAGLLRRDPRVQERKRTNRLSARTGRVWRRR